MADLKNQRKRKASAARKSNKEQIPPKASSSSSRGSRPSVEARRFNVKGIVDRCLNISEEEGKELDKLEAEMEAEEAAEEAVAAGQPETEDGPSEDEQDSNDENDELNEYEIKYEVPYENATRQLTLKSTTPWDTFMLAVAAKMNTRVTLLTRIGYIPSFAPKTPKPVPKLLEDAESYEAMMDDIDNFIETCKATRKGQGKVKPFSVKIIDTTSGGDGPSMSKTSKKKGGPEKTAAAPLEDFELQEHKITKQILQRHACPDHAGKACYVLDDGKHYQYTNADLTIWATLLRSHLATIDTPPEKLNITDKVKKHLSLPILALVLTSIG